MMPRGRRAFLLAPLLTASCGWHPVYAPGSAGVAGPAQAGLAATNVALIPERSGQLLRLALQERFERFGAVAASKYDLAVSYGVSAEGIAITPNTTTTRLRYVGTADWKLSAQDAQRTTLTSGNARSIDGLNVINQQYFAADLEGEQVQRRIAEAVADQITQQLAAYFTRHASSG